MKNLLILLVLLVLSPELMEAQDQEKDRDQDHTRLMMVDGNLLQIKDREQTQLKDKVTLNDGTVLSPNGRYVTRDGKKMRLRDGEFMDMDGIGYNNEYQYRFKVMQENKGLSQDQMRERNQNRTQFVVMDGNVYRIRSHEQSRLQEQMTLNNGMMVNPDGTYMDRDQKQQRLRDGECLTMNGQKYQDGLQQRKMLMHKSMSAHQNMNKSQKQQKVQKNVQVKTPPKKKGKN